MTLQQLAEEYKKLLGVTNFFATVIQEMEILQHYPEGRTGRIWSNHSCWIYEGDAIANIPGQRTLLSIVRYKELMEKINENPELKLLIQGVDLNTINKKKE